MAGSEDDETTSYSASCSICLDLVRDEGDRSRAKLPCGHEFHLDCIGSAFNMKGAMQCPNCRNIEKGRWLYASGSTFTFPESSVDVRTPDEDPYELSYSEMPFRVHWCPLRGLAEMESPSTYNSIQRHHPIFAEHTAYFEPIPMVSSNSIESVENPNFNHSWNIISHNEIFTGNGFPVIDIHHQSWGHHPRPFSSNGGHINSTDQASVRPATLRPTRGPYDAMTRSDSSAHPFLYGHGNSQTHEGTPASHAIHHWHRPINPPVTPSPSIPDVRRFNGPSGRFFNFLPPGSSGRNLHQTENSSLNRVQAQERNHVSHIPVISVDRFHHGGGGGSDSIHRSGNFRHRPYQS
ncbi:RING-H2 finger protein [Actinidia chinensis var. chinensis]|uniref:RING-H2 finger protein n=1 Tax=Actinidia chinensis var. chinensis TaxID=1590841 RepID=A0A2R6P5R2_ACTCC|nr:RING-H2 finger protein [Actinidia chinensis var. chinensis]